MNSKYLRVTISLGKRKQNEGLKFSQENDLTWMLSLSGFS
jgi:hypothetical protein